MAGKSPVTDEARAETPKTKRNEEKKMKKMIDEAKAVYEAKVKESKRILAEAKAKAMAEGRIGVDDEGYSMVLYTKAEDEAICKANKERFEAFEKMEALKKQYRAEQKVEAESKKARENGLTVEEYKAKVNKERKIKRLEKEVAELEEALAKAKARLEKARVEG